MLGVGTLGQTYLGGIPRVGSGPPPVYFRDFALTVALIGALSPTVISRTDIQVDARATQVTVE